MQIGELCERLGIEYRHARYVLEEAMLPEGVDAAPDRGNHRQLDSGQAFWLGIVLMLKRSGFRTPLAATVANAVKDAVRRLGSSIAWEAFFRRSNVGTELEEIWKVEIADLGYIRVTTTKRDGKNATKASSWVAIGTARTVKSDVVPVVTIRIDLTQLASMLR